MIYGPNRKPPWPHRNYINITITNRWVGVFWQSPKIGEETRRLQLPMGLIYELTEAKYLFLSRGMRKGVNYKPMPLQGRKISAVFPLKGWLWDL